MPTSRPCLGTPKIVAAALVALVTMLALSSSAVQAQELGGCWDGRWENWHDPFVGRMKARVTKCDAMHYQGEFWGIALIVIPYRYTTTLTVTHVEDGKTYFRANDFLGIWGGYTMCGYICGDEMHARYTKCKGDGGGCLNMCRTCCPGCGCCNCR